MMTKAVADLLYGPMFDLMGNGFSIGSIVSVIAIILSYAINKAMSLVDNK